MAPKQDTHSLLLKLLEMVTELRVKMDGLAELPARVTAVERKQLEPELVNTRFKAVEGDVAVLKDWRAQREGEVRGAGWTLNKVLVAGATMLGAIWAVVTFVVPLLMRAG